MEEYYDIYCEDIQSTRGFKLSRHSSSVHALYRLPKRAKKPLFQGWLNFLTLKVHKIENFFGSDFEICTISLLVLLKYEDFVTPFFIGPLLGEI